MVATHSAMLPLGTPAPDFSLPDAVTGALRTRHEFRGRPLLVMFICNHCPYVQFIRPVLAEVTAQYLDSGVAVVGINSNDVEAQPDDGPEAMAREAAAAGYRFPYLFDADQSVAAAYHAACTPDFQLYDRDHRLFYRGQFCSARRKVAPPQVPTGADLSAAVAAVLAGGQPPQPQRPSIGCNIKWRPGNEPAYFRALVV
jgi:thiol-disulfide isomerase/thioredoxin